MKLGNDTIVLVTRELTGERDRYGSDVVRDVYSEWRWCLVTPTTATEPEGQTAARVTGLQVLAPRRVPLSAAAAVIWPATATTDPDKPWDGPSYEVDGDVGDWRTYQQAQLTRST